MAGDSSAGRGAVASFAIGKDGTNGLSLPFDELICSCPRSTGAGEEPGLRILVSQE